MAKTVDVTIRGKNEAGKAFRDATGDVSKFEKGIQKLTSPLHFLKGILAGLGIASLGAIFRKATSAALEHEKGLGRNVAQLDRLSSAWDFVLVRLGQAILGMDGAGKGTEGFTKALIGLGNWIDENRGKFAEFANILLKIVTGFASIGRWMEEHHMGFGGLFTTKGGQKAGRDFQSFQDEQKKIVAAKEAKDARDAALKQFRDEMKQSDKANARSDALGDLISKQGNFSRTGGTLQGGNIGSIGERPNMPSLAPIGGTAPQIDTATKGVTEMTVAVQALNEEIKAVGTEAIGSFADAWADAVGAIVNGSQRMGAAIGNAIRKGVGMGMIAQGRSNILEAGALAVKGLFNPVDWWRAGRLLLYGTAQVAAGTAFAGGGGGGSAGGLGGGGFSQQQSETAGKGDATIIIKGGILDMNDPRQADALADALEQLSGRRITILGARP